MARISNEHVAIHFILAFHFFFFLIDIQSFFIVNITIKKKKFPPLKQKIKINLVLF